MTLRILSATAPSHWACYLVNGDGSDLEPDEADAAEAFVDKFLGGQMPVSCEDAGFMWHHDAMNLPAAYGVLAADCQTYTSLVE